MVKLPRSDIRAIDEALDVTSGYVLNFSDRTMAEFFEDHSGLEIYDEKYSFNGSSKAKHLRAFIAAEEAPLVSYVLRALWEYRSTLPAYIDLSPEVAAAENAKAQASFAFLADLRAKAAPPQQMCLKDLKLILLSTN